MRSDQGLHPMGKLSKNVVGGVGGGGKYYYKMKKQAAILATVGNPSL